MTKSYIEHVADCVQIPRAEYLQLVRDQNKLLALERNGVDNWEWYSDAMAELKDDHD